MKALSSAPYVARVVCAFCAAGVNKSRLFEICTGFVQVAGGHEHSLIDAHESTLLQDALKGATRDETLYGLGFLLAVASDLVGKAKYDGKSLKGEFEGLPCPSRLQLNIIALCILNNA